MSLILMKYFIFTNGVISTTFVLGSVFRKYNMEYKYRGTPEQIKKSMRGKWLKPEERKYGQEWSEYDVPVSERYFHEDDLPEGHENPLYKSIY